MGKKKDDDDKKQSVHSAAAQLGKLGGDARSEVLPAARKVAIAKKAAEKRWSK